MEILIDPGEVPDIELTAIERLSRAGLTIAPLACESVLNAAQYGLLDDQLPTVHHLRQALDHSIKGDRLAYVPEMVAS